MRFTIQESKVLSSGADGGHHYLSGVCEWQRKPVRVFAFMLNKVEEALLQNGINLIDGEVDSYIDGIGLTLNNCRVTNDKSADYKVI